jgi:putative hydrolase of the HAD superfamily
LIGALKAAGKKLAILSNELDLFFGKELRESLAVLGDVDVITDGTYSKILKADPRDYQACHNQLGLEGGECVFIVVEMRIVTVGQTVGLRALHLAVQNPRDVFNRALRELGIAQAFTAPGKLAPVGQELSQ